MAGDLPFQQWPFGTFRVCREDIRPEIDGTGFTIRSNSGQGVIEKRFADRCEVRFKQTLRIDVDALFERQVHQQAAAHRNGARVLRNLAIHQAGIVVQKKQDDFLTDRDPR